MKKFQKLFKELKKLNLPINQFSVFAGASLAILKIRESGDIDIIVKEELWKKLSKKYKIQKRGLSECIDIKDIEIWHDLLPLSKDVDKYINNSNIIDKIPFIKLKYTLQWKIAYNREKDQNDIKLIKDYLKKKKC